MNIKKEVETLREQIHKAYVRAGTLQAIVTNEPGPTFSGELHKLTADLETLTLGARNLDANCFVGNGDLAKRTYNKHWDADIVGRVEVDENDWLHITLNTLLPHYKYNTNPYLKDTIVRLLSNYQLRGGTLPYYSSAMLVIDERCAIGGRHVLDQDNKGWKAIPNALKGLVIADDDQFSLGIALISTWDRDNSCNIHVMDIGDAGTFFSFQTGDCGAYFR